MLVGSGRGGGIPLSQNKNIHRVWGQRERGGGGGLLSSAAKNSVSKGRIGEDLNKVDKLIGKVCVETV